MSFFFGRWTLAIYFDRFRFRINPVEERFAYEKKDGKMSRRHIAWERPFDFWAQFGPVEIIKRYP